MVPRLSPARIALVALLIALTTIVTGWTLRVPVPATQGYFNLSDIPITFIGLVFGPWVGLVAGGVGAALADVFGGYAFFAPVTLVAHGVEGLLIGLLGRGRRSVGGMILAWVPGALAMVLVYFLAEGVLKGWPAALVEVPVNLFQGLLGAIFGILLVLAVRKAYPPIDRLGQRKTWTE